MTEPFPQVPSGRRRDRRRFRSARAVTLAVGLLGLLVSCRPGARAEQRGEPEPPPESARDSAEAARQLAELNRIGPTAKTDRAALVQVGRAIRSPYHEVASRAGYWLAQAGLRAAPILLTALADTSPRIRTSAAHALGLLGPSARGAIPALTRQLAGEDDSAANMADWALTQIAPAGKGPLISELRGLRYGPVEDRVDAASRLALLGVGATEAIPGLVRALADSEGVVAESAGDALVRIGPGSIPALQAALLSDNPLLRTRALQVLSRLRPHSHF